MEVVLEYVSNTMGLSFCQVSMIMAFNQFNPSIISGNQKWNGAAPILMNNEVLKIKLK